MIALSQRAPSSEAQLKDGARRAALVLGIRTDAMSSEDPPVERQRDGKMSCAVTGSPAFAADPSSLCPFGHQRIARGQPWQEAPPCSLASIKQGLTLAGCAGSPILIPSLLTLDLRRKSFCLLQETRPAFELDYFGSPYKNSGDSLSCASSQTPQYMEKCKLYQT